MQFSWSHLHFPKAYKSLLNCMLYVPCMPAWSTCPRTNASRNVPTCQRCVNCSTWRAKVPTTCQFLNLAYQRAKWRVNFSFLGANVPIYVLNFQTFLLRNAKRNLYTLLLYKKFLHYTWYHSYTYDVYIYRT